MDGGSRTSDGLWWRAKHGSQWMAENDEGRIMTVGHVQMVSTHDGRHRAQAEANEGWQRISGVSGTLGCKMRVPLIGSYSKVSFQPLIIPHAASISFPLFSLSP